MKAAHFKRGAVALAVAAALVPATLPAQDLPTASELIDRYVEAMGGRDAIVSQPGSHSKGTFSMPAAGLEATMEIYSARDPYRSTTIVEIPGMGTVREGYTGEHAWAMDPTMGPRLKEGEELDAARESASTEAALRDESLFTERTTVEQTEMNGEACYKVRLVWKSGRETFDCYSTETGLLVATESTQATPMGDIPVVALISDYEKFGDVLSPTRVTQQMMGQEQVITIESVEYRAIDDEQFAPPPAIQTLIEQRESGQ